MEMAKMKLEMILGTDDLKRISYYTDEETGLPVIRIDLHKLNAIQAKRAFHNILACCREKFILNVIHGYNNGIALKSITGELLKKSDRFLEDRSQRNNPGVTIALIAAA